MVVDRGFTLLEVLMGFFVLAIAFVSLGAYSSTQRTGLNRSSRLADETQIAISTVEGIKGRLADSAQFRSQFDRAALGPDVTTLQKTFNNIHYTVDVSIERGPDPLYALNVQARVYWKAGHAIELGVLVPGTSASL